MVLTERGDRPVPAFEVRRDTAPLRHVIGPKVSSSCHKMLLVSERQKVICRRHWRPSLSKPSSTHGVTISQPTKQRPRFPFLLIRQFAVDIGPVALEATFLRRPPPLVTAMRLLGRGDAFLCVSLPRLGVGTVIGRKWFAWIHGGLISAGRFRFMGHRLPGRCLR